MKTKEFINEIQRRFPESDIETIEDALNRVIGTEYEHIFSKEIDILQTLEHLRDQIQKEQISYGEIAELQSLSEYIDEDDVELKEWAGILEFTEDDE